LELLSDDFLERSYGKAVVDRFASKSLLQKAIRCPEKRSCVTSAQLTVANISLDRRGELEKPEGVRDSRPGAAHLASDLLVRQVEFLDQLLISTGLVERVEVFTVQILH
jgi:hypothetical protein